MLTDLHMILYVEAQVNVYITMFSVFFEDTPRSIVFDTRTEPLIILHSDESGTRASQSVFDMPE